MKRILFFGPEEKPVRQFADALAASGKYYPEICTFELGTAAEEFAPDVIVFDLRSFHPDYEGSRARLAAFERTDGARRSSIILISQRCDSERARRKRLWGYRTVTPPFSIEDLFQVLATESTTPAIPFFLDISFSAAPHWGMHCFRAQHDRLLYRGFWMDAAKPSWERAFEPTAEQWETILQLCDQHHLWSVPPSLGDLQCPGDPYCNLEARSGARRMKSSGRFCACRSHRDHLLRLNHSLLGLARSSTDIRFRLEVVSSGAASPAPLTCQITNPNDDDVLFNAIVMFPLPLSDFPGMNDDLLYIHREPTILRKGETLKVPIILNGPGFENHVVDRAEFTARAAGRGGIVVVYEDDRLVQCGRTPLPPIPGTGVGE